MIWKYVVYSCFFRNMKMKTKMWQYAHRFSLANMIWAASWEKPAFCVCINKKKLNWQISMVTPSKWSPHSFSLQWYFLNLKSQSFSHLLWQYRQVCLRHGQKPLKTGFLLTLHIFLIANSCKYCTYRTWKIAHITEDKYCHNYMYLWTICCIFQISCSLRTHNMYKTKLTFNKPYHLKTCL